MSPMTPIMVLGGLAPPSHAAAGQQEVLKIGGSWRSSFFRSRLYKNIIGVLYYSLHYTSRHCDRVVYIFSPIIAAVYSGHFN